MLECTTASHILMFYGENIRTLPCPPSETLIIQDYVYAHVARCAPISQNYGKMYMGMCVSWSDSVLTSHGSLFKYVICDSTPMDLVLMYICTWHCQLFTLYEFWSMIWSSCIYLYSSLVGFSNDICNSCLLYYMFFRTLSGNVKLNLPLHIICQF